MKACSLIVMDLIQSCDRLVFKVDREYQPLCSDIAPTFTGGSFSAEVRIWLVKQRGYHTQETATKYQDYKGMTIKCSDFPFLLASHVQRSFFLVQQTDKASYLICSKNSLINSLMIRDPHFLIDDLASAYPSFGDV